MDKPSKRPSLRDFDYFADQAENQDDHASHHGGDRLGFGQSSRPSQGPSTAPADDGGVQPRQIVSLVLTAAFLLFAAWFAWQFRDCARYAFSPAQAPLRLGEVSELTPEVVQHNTYVQVHGITEHRGLHAKAIRGLSWRHSEYWYFRLMGSRGIFVEVAPDVETFGPNTEVTVQGRAVDPDVDPLYGALLKSYEATFATELRAHRRIIQVGFAPGEGRARYIVAMGFFVLCAGLFMLHGWRLLQSLLKRTSTPA